MYVQTSFTVRSHQNRCCPQKKKCVFFSQFFIHCKWSILTAHSNAVIQIQMYQHPNANIQQRTDIFIAFSNHFLQFTDWTCSLRGVPTAPRHLPIFFFAHFFAYAEYLCRLHDYEGERSRCSRNWMTNGNKYRSTKVKNIRIFKSGCCGKARKAQFFLPNEWVVCTSECYVDWVMRAHVGSRCTYFLFIFFISCGIFSKRKLNTSQLAVCSVIIW